MNTQLIQQRICLESKYLDSNIMEHLTTQIRKNNISRCTKEWGHILDVRGIREIVNHEIGNANSDNVFIVIFEATILNPLPGLRVSGNVCMVYQDGLFVNIQDIQKMLIPASNMEEYEYDTSQQAFILKEGEGEDEPLGVGSFVSCVIIASQYTNNKFSCFGKLAQPP